MGIDKTVIDNIEETVLLSEYNHFHTQDHARRLHWGSWNDYKPLFQDGRRSPTDSGESGGGGVTYRRHWKGHH